MCQCDNEEIKAKAKTKDKEEVQALWIIHYLQNPKPETQNAKPWNPKLLSRLLFLF